MGLYRDCSCTRILFAFRKYIETTFSKGSFTPRYSQSLCLTLQLTARNATLQPVCDETHSSGPAARSRFVLRVRPPPATGHRAGKFIDLKVNVSGELVSSLRSSNSLSFKNHEQKSPRGSFLRARRGTLYRELKWALLSAAQPKKSAHRGRHTHRARPSAPRSLPRRPPVIVLSTAAPRRGFFTQSQRRQLNSAKTNTTTLMFSLKVTWL